MGDLIPSPATVEAFDSPDTTVDDIAMVDPSLVIIDLKLGGVADGWELLLGCCEDQRFASVPLVLCSADIRGLEEHNHEIAGLPNVSVLRKPFTIEEFEHLLARTLATSTL